MQFANGKIACSIKDFCSLLVVLVVVASLFLFEGVFTSLFEHDNEFAKIEPVYAMGSGRDLRIDKQKDPGAVTVNSGDYVDYTLTILNKDEGGSVIGNNVIVRDTLPTGMSFTNVWSSNQPAPFVVLNSWTPATGVIEWIINPIFEDESITITYEVRHTLVGTMKNYAEVLPDSGAPTEDIPHGTGTCTDGLDPTQDGVFAVAGTNNVDCEEIVVGNEAIDGECGDDDLGEFYLPSEPTALCNEGIQDPLVHDSFVGWTWACKSSTGGSNDDCSATELFCGDGVRQIANSEACDDGNMIDGDGCSSACEIEGCTNSVAYNYSGSATIDDGSCRLCGDSIIDLADGESCDDGGTNSNDGCSNTCQEEIIRLLNVNPLTDEVTIKNMGTTDVDVSAYRFCSLFSYTFGGIQDLDVVSGSLLLGSDDEVTLSGFALTDTAADLGLYFENGSFSSTGAMIDFVQRGSAGNGRESVAQSKGIWTAGDFLDENSPFNYVGDGEQYGLTYWDDVPSVCGNSRIEIGELCDDGNDQSNDGCTSSCDAIESGWSCPVAGVPCVDDNECAGEGAGNTCDTNALCTNEPGTYSCACDAGYTGDGETCTDVDECGLGTHSCSSDATCTNTVGSFTCACNAGFSGDGESCVDDNECIGEGTGNTCDTNALCTNEPGTYTCVCDAGFSGDGESCVDDNECVGEGTGNTCDTNALCTNEPGTYSCACDAGYTGDGETCTDVDECGLGTHSCSSDAICTNTVGSFTCACNAGFSGDGESCTEICGDTIVAGDEDCDDGGQVNGDGCNEFCAWEIPTCTLVVTPSSGLLPLVVTGVVSNLSGREMLDSIDRGDGTSTFSAMQTEGNTYFTTGMMTVTATVVHADNATISGTCETIVQASTVCGNNSVEPGEICDDGLLNGVACNAAYDATCTYCTNTCTQATANGAFCGDGAEDNVEECDLGAILNDGTCTAPYGGTCNGCTSGCLLSVVEGGFCGDGIEQPEEECDDGNSIGDDNCSNTCKTITHNNGTASSISSGEFIRPQKESKKEHTVASDEKIVLKEDSSMTGDEQEDIMPEELSEIEPFKLDEITDKNSSEEDIVTPDTEEKTISPFKAAVIRLMQEKLGVTKKSPNEYSPKTITIGDILSKSPSKNNSDFDTTSKLEKPAEIFVETDEMAPVSTHSAAGESELAPGEREVTKSPRELLIETLKKLSVTR